MNIWYPMSHYFFFSIYGSYTYMWMSFYVNLKLNLCWLFCSITFMLILLYNNFLLCVHILSRCFGKKCLLKHSNSFWIVDIKTTFYFRPANIISCNINQCFKLWIWWWSTCHYNLWAEWGKSFGYTCIYVQQTKWNRC